nr:chloride channel protein [Corynebacterium lactis]
MSETDLPEPTTWLRLCIYTLVIGIATGLVAAGLALTMHGVEWLVYGQHEGDVAVVTDGTTGMQRFVGITLAGLVAGPAWAALRRLATPIESVEAGMNGHVMPVWATTANVLLQMATVAAGASMGRENAPREAGAMMASQLSAKLGLDPLTRRILVAAAAGAGLGAIYHIPLAGAIFSLEILLGSLSITAVMVVLACSAVATVTSGIVVGNSPLYNPIGLSEGWGNLGAALLLGVLCGAAGYAFRYASSRASEKAPTGWHGAWAIPLAFAAVGVASLWLPEILGNGRIAASMVLLDRPLLGFAVVLLVAKTIAVLITFRSGAVGGVLTPGFALGALSGFIVGCLVQPFMPAIPLSDYALLGAASFLSASMAAPFFALIVTVEFTGQSSDAYLALFLASATASLTVAVIRSGLNLPRKQFMPWNRRPARASTAASGLHAS